MLTGGVGYTYAISSTRPLTQVNLPAYPYNAGTGIGGLIVAAPDVWKVGTGYTGRRAVVETARCNNCHVQLGVGPTFHAGQRNDAPTCSFCHNPNRTSSGWSANVKDFVHSIHAGRVRTVDFNWHAISPAENYGEVEFPSNLNNCEACHAVKMYDFSQAATIAALPNMLPSTVGTGKYDRSPVTNASGYFQISPYVVADNVKDYGLPYKYTAGVDGGVVNNEADPTTLVKTPITAACTACHDAPDAVAHMRQMGGKFYDPRSDTSRGTEQCLICHGPGTIAPIAIMHRN
jgi:OmcA/MtrC family decaheme c-type cytochrome